VVGSIKSNVGHLEGASGLAGVIKATLTIEKGKILPNMHFNTPNPEIDFKKHKITVPTEVMDWPSSSSVRRASINSFGYGGSNAHVILENYQPRVRTVLPELDLGLEENVDRRPFLIPLTSHSERAGKKLSARLQEYLALNPAVKAYDIAKSLSIRRSVHQVRSFAIGYDSETLFRDVSTPKPVAAWTRSTADKQKLGFVFTGQGAQWYAMGRQLIETEPLFRQRLEKCDEILRRLPDAPSWSCVNELLQTADESRLSQSEFSQPLCCALQLALVDLLSQWGITPSAVIGHSSGEIAAAYAAGILSFDNSIICAYYRGLYMSNGVKSEISKRGAMMAVGLTEGEGIAELKAYKGRIALAAINSPSSLTLSGDEDAIIELKTVLDERKVFARQLLVEQAFHSHHMFPLAPGFERALSSTQGFESLPAKTRMFSSVTARDSSARKMDAQYWAANMTGVVRYSDALTGMLLDEDDELAVDILVEIGPHPALKGPSKQLMKSLKLDVPYLGSLNRDAPAFESLLSLAGQLFSLGYPVDLAAVNSSHFSTANGQVSKASYGKRLTDLPSYAWDHVRFWGETRLVRDLRQRKNRHSVLGAPMAGSPDKRPRWRSFLRQSELAWLSEHVVDKKVIFPAAGYISMAIEAIATQVPEFKNISLRDVMFKSALILPDTEQGSEVMFELEPMTSSSKNTSSTWYRFNICSFDENGRTVEHCHGLVSAEKGEPEIVGLLPTTTNFAKLQASTSKCKPRTAYYKMLSELGLNYGENFQLISKDIESGPGFSVAPLTFDPKKVRVTDADECILHPTILDASFHVIFAAVETLLGRPLDEAFVPTFVRNMTVSGLLNTRKSSMEEQQFWVKTDTKLPGSRTAINNVSILSNRSNDIFVELKGLEVTALGNDSAGPETKRSLFFQTRWLPAFDQLGSSITTPHFESIAELLDTYAHQFPDSKILHLTSTHNSTKALLKKLGGTNGERRRFHNITVSSPSKAPLESAKELETVWPGLIVLEEIKEAEYDVIVVSDPVNFDITHYLKDSGYVINESTSDLKLELQSVFDSGRFNVYRKNALQEPSEDLDLILSNRPSEVSKSLAKSIEVTYKGKVNTISIDDITQQAPTATNIISLVSLDENIFFDNLQEEPSRYRALQKLLTNADNKNVVWLLQSATHETSNPAQALIIGLARSASSENENIHIATLDLPSIINNTVSCRHAIAALAFSSSENELAERNGLLSIPRVDHNDGLNRKLPSGGQRQPRMEPLKDGRKLALKIGKVGLLDTLQFEDDEDILDTEELDDDDIEVEVKASALNFRDIAASIGIIDDYRLGDECSGVVVRVGKNIKESDFKPGDRVLACRPGQGAHRAYVRNPAILCQKIEDNMDFVTAASFEGVFTTAYYSLVDVGRLQPGEYCLVHAAAGGVGQMAVQLAQKIGAHVIATVGSQVKRDFLKETYGLTDDMIFSSRDASFVDGVLKVTNGRGCDVALNSLAGELLHATWGCIAPFGRLIEIGKRDIHENTKLDMEPFRRNITYASVDLITLFNLNRPLLARLIRDCYHLIADGSIKPAGPITEVSYADAQKAFRMLQMERLFLFPRKTNLCPLCPQHTETNHSSTNPKHTYL
jgi:acyl transferase domain-containing protein/NADPH:quinone reductase-like Zn-dependent oxidoreductase